MVETATGPGRVRITAAFQHAAAQRAAALMPYYTLGYPDRETSLAVIEAIAPHSDLLELGVPFSDPLADGPIIQHSTQKSLEAGTTTAGCLEMVRTLRARGVQTPAMLMGYYNPILAYGEERYVRDAADAGADGFIVPDLPPEEADTLEVAAAEAGLALIHFLAPTSSRRRIEQIVARAQGFIYMVSLTGVTGTDAGPASGLASFVRGVRGRAKVPVAVGFGIKSPAQAAAVAAYADGVIVGSALIRAVNDAGDDQSTAAAAFVRALQAALQRDRLAP